MKKLLLALLFSTHALASVSLPYTFSSGSLIQSAQVNADFSALASEINTHESLTNPHQTALSDVLVVSNSCGGNNIDFNDNQALNLILEALSSDPTPANAGRIFTSGGVPKFDTGSKILELLTAGTGGGDFTVGTIDTAAASANGMAITGASIYAQSASISNPGLVNNSTQSFSGNKTFTGALSLSSTLAVASAATLSGGVTVSGASLTGPTGIFTNLQDSGLTASKAITTDASDNLVSSLTTSTELGYVHGVTSAIQTQINSIAGSVTSIGAVSGTSTAKGADLTGNVLTLHYADVTNPGLLSATTQSIAGAKTFTAAETISDTTASSSYTTGALVVAGGVGIAGQLTLNGSVVSTNAGSFNNLNVTGAISSTTPANGAIQTAGGMGVSGALNVGTNVGVIGTISSTGAIASVGTVSGSNLTTGGHASLDALAASPTITGTLTAASGTYSNQLAVTSAIPSSSFTTGALVVTGGVGVGGNTITNGFFFSNAGTSTFQGVSDLGTMAVSGVSTLGGSTQNTPVVIVGDPTRGRQIQLANSGQASSLGTEYSSGDVFLAENAQQVADNTDNWQQNSAGSKSQLLEVDVTNGLRLFQANPGVASASKATFWGSSSFSVSPSGALTTAGTGTFTAGPLEVGTAAPIGGGTEEATIFYGPSTVPASTSYALRASVAPTGNTVMTANLHGLGGSIVRTISSNTTDTDQQDGMLLSVTYTAPSGVTLTNSNQVAGLSINKLTQTTAGSTAAFSTYRAIAIVADNTTVNGFKTGIHIGDVTNGTENALIDDNATYSSGGLWGINFTGDTKNLFSGTMFLPGIGTSTSALDYVCWNAATGALTGDSSGTCLTSLRDQKENIEDLKDGLAEVLSLRPVSFDYKPEFNPNHMGRQVGFIAEEVEKVDPRLASYSHKTGKLRSVMYSQTPAVLVKAIQELNQKVEKLELELSELKKEK